MRPRSPRSPACFHRRSWRLSGRTRVIVRGNDHTPGKQLDLIEQADVTQGRLSPASSIAIVGELNRGTPSFPSRDQKIINPSSQAVARRVPSGDQATACTQSVCPPTAPAGVAGEGGGLPGGGARPGPDPVGVGGGMKVSGNTTSAAPARPESLINLQAFSVVASRSRNTGRHRRRRSGPLRRRCHPRMCSPHSPPRQWIWARMAPRVVERQKGCPRAAVIGAVAAGGERGTIRPSCAALWEPPLPCQG